MRRPVVPTFALVVTALVALSGCGVLDDLTSGGEPERDEQGSVTEAATDDVLALKVGDCLDSTDLGETVEEVPFVPCGEAHDSEVYASTELADGDYPGEKVIEKTSDAFCYGRFASFVGLDYESSALDYYPLYPVEDGWNFIDDREVLCVIIDLDGDVTGTLQSAAR